MNRFIHILGGLVVLGFVAAAAFLLTNHVQEHVSVLPGLNGCWRLDSGEQMNCLSEQFLEGADKAAGSRSGKERDTAVIAYVRSAEVDAASDQRLGGMCHPAMHQLGRREGTRAASESRTPTFPGGSSQLCTAGYVHGLAEGYLAKSPDADVSVIFPKLCWDPAARAGCAHGIGHAMYRAQKSAGISDRSGAALDRCSGLPSDFESDCQNGVYMEVAMRVDPAPVKVRDYVHLCQSTKDVIRSLACWGYVGLNFSSNSTPISEMPAWCDKATLPSHYTCIENYGRTLGINGVAQCGSSANTVGLRERCVDGAVGLQVGSGHISAHDAARMCKSIDDQHLVSYCSSAIKRYERGRAAVEAT